MEIAGGNWESSNNAVERNLERRGILAYVKGSPVADFMFQL